MKNPLKADPTRTTGLRKAFLREMGRRFKLLAKDIRKLVVEEDAFNLDLKKPLVIMAMKQFAFQTSEQKVQSFNKWFQGRIDERVLTVDHAGKPWTSKYVDSAYKKGSIRAYTDTHKKSLMKSQDFYEGSKDQFLKSAFMQPERMSKVRLLGTRVFEQLKGVTAEMGAKMNTLAAEGIAHGKNPISIARQMAKNISGLTRKRANVIARTEVIYAHAEGQLDSFEDLGVKELGVMAEWSTAGDDRVCPQCSELEGTVMTIEQARGMIPLHPNCRCAWVPANVGEKVRKRRKILEKWGEKGEPVFKSPVSKKKLGIPVPSKPKPKMKPKIKLSPAEELQVDEKLKSIKRVTFAPQEGASPMEIAKNEKDIREALSLVPPEAVEGMEALKVTGGGEFIGSAMYIPPTKAGGYVSDELWLMEGWLKKSSLGRKQELLHEVGHRMYYVRPDLTREFKKKKLGKYFSSITDPEFAKRYTKAQKAGETFAESFSNHLLKKPQPKELEAFWKKAGVGKVVKAKPIPTLKPKPKLKPTLKPKPKLKPTLKPTLKPKPKPKPKVKPKPKIPSVPQEALPNYEDVPLPMGRGSWSQINPQTIPHLSPKQLGAYADFTIKNPPFITASQIEKLTEVLPQKYADAFGKSLISPEFIACTPVRLVDRAIESGHLLPKINPGLRKKIIDMVKIDTFRTYKKTREYMYEKLVQQMWIFDDTFAAGMNAVERKAFVKKMIQKGWAESSRSISSQIMQQALKEVTGSKAPLWNPSSTYSLERVMSEIPKNVMDSVKAHVKETYESTQRYLKGIVKMKEIVTLPSGKTKEIATVAFPGEEEAYYVEMKGGKVRLLRGVKEKVSVQSPLSSWTTERSVASRFDGEEILVEFVDPKDIYVSVGSPAWTGMTEEFEFIRIAR